MTRPTNDLAWEAARSLCRIIAPALRDDELHDFFMEALAVCRGLLKDYVDQMNREGEVLFKPPPVGSSTS